MINPSSLKLTNLSRRHKANGTWPKEKRLQAVVQYLALGNMRLVAATTGVSYDLLRQWKTQPWWKEYEIEIRNTENLELDNKLTTLVQRSLTTVADRLEHGDHILNNKTGELVRKPVNMKDAAKVSVDLLTKRELLRGNATSRTEATSIPVVDQLKLLAAEFARMTTGKPSEVIDVEMVEILQEDVQDGVDGREEESSWESSLLDSESGGATSLYEGSESEELSEEGGSPKMGTQPDS